MSTNVRNKSVVVFAVGAVGGALLTAALLAVAVLTADDPFFDMVHYPHT